MEKTQMQIGVPKSSKGKEVLTGLGITAVIMVVGLVWISQPVQAEDAPYEPQAPLAIESRTANEKALCLNIKQVGNAKLLDDANGVDMGDEFNRDVTAKYRDMNCDSVKLNISVDFQ